jgi:nucleotide-binding universal stress UspA family protein
MFEKILVPLDTSQMAEQALPYAADLAGAFGSEVSIINICQSSGSSEVNFCQSYVEAEAEKLKRGLAGQDFKIKTQVIHGSAAQTILEYIHEQNINLIFMSSHGRSGVVLWPVGSTVDKVIRRTRIPLIIVRVKEAQKDNTPMGIYKRILVALDGSELAAKVVPFVSEIAAKFTSEVVLIRVIETERQVHNLGRMDRVPFIANELQSMQKRAEEYLVQEAQRFSRSGTVITVVKTGNAAEEIIKYASEHNCSLIALSSHAHSGLESWVIGSVTNKIVHAGNKSLLLAPALES